MAEAGGAGSGTSHYGGQASGGRTDPERALLSKAIHGGGLDELVARGIEPSHFADPDCRGLYAKIRAHDSHYHSPPSVQAVRDMDPDMRLEVSSDSLDYLIDRFMQAVKRRKAIELYRDFGEACDDPERVLDIETVAMEMATTLMEVIPQSRLSRYSDEEDRIEEYVRMKAMGTFDGLETGFPTIDGAIVGIRPHQLVVVAGFANTGKSMVMQRAGWNIYRQGRRILFISLEMSEDECYARWTSMATGIENRALRAMEVAEDSVEFERWKAEAKIAKEFRADRDIAVLDNLSVCTPDRVLVETRRYQPDIVKDNASDVVVIADQRRGRGQGRDPLVHQLQVHGQARRHRGRNHPHRGDEGRAPDGPVHPEVPQRPDGHRRQPAM